VKKYRSARAYSTKIETWQHVGKKSGAPGEEVGAGGVSSGRERERRSKTHSTLELALPFMRTLALVLTAPLVLAAPAYSQVRGGVPIGFFRVQRQLQY
jgi:hypothetical protein